MNNNDEKKHSKIGVIITTFSAIYIFLRITGLYDYIIKLIWG